MKAVNPANITTTGNGNLEENGLYALLISRQEEIIGLVKLLLPKSTMNPRVIHIRPLFGEIMFSSAPAFVFATALYWPLTITV